MNKQSGRIGLYLVLIVMLVAGYFYLNNQVASQSSYSMESMKQAAEMVSFLLQKSTRTGKCLPVPLLRISKVKGRKSICNRC